MIKTFLNRYVKAGSLLFTLYVSLVLYLIAASFVLMYYIYSNYINRYIAIWELENTCYSGLAQYFSEPNEYSINTLHEIEINNKSDVKLKKKTWGFFELIEINTKRGKHTLSGYFLVGASQKGLKTLYIADNNKTIKVRGNTNLNGNIYVPGAHLQRNYFSGTIQPTDSLRKSNKNLPAYNQKTIENLQILNFKNTKPVSFDNFKKKHIAVPLSDSVLFLYSENPINLSDIELHGKIIIHSKKRINVYASASFKDIILYAPVIKLNMGVVGSGQLFADSLITIENNCKLEYPSVLAGIGKSNSIIQLNSGASIAGGIILFSESSNDYSRIILNKNSIVYGIVYSKGICEINGNIFGGLFTKYISTTNFSSELNIIENVTIDGKALKTEFILPLFLKDQQREVIDVNFTVKKNSEDY